MESEAVKKLQYNGNAHSIREKLIKARGVNRRQMSQRLGGFQKYLSKLELGQGILGLKTAIKIAFIGGSQRKEAT